jgi:hypothetical protein
MVFNGGMTEQRYWRLSLAIPIVVPVIVAVPFALAGCFDVATRGCLDSLSSNNPIKLIAYVLLASIPFGLPPYLIVLVAGLAALRRFGAGWVRPWLWCTPLGYGLVFVAFWSAVWLPSSTESWLQSIVRPGLVALLAGYFYVAVGYLGFRILRPQ